MSVGSKEFYDVIKAFETTLKYKNNHIILSNARLDKEDRTEWTRGYVYQNGEVNSAFYAFMWGYEYAKMMARSESLPLEG